MTSKLQNDLISFIRKEIGEYKMEITTDTSIEDDLGVTGDDGTELIKNFSKEFSVDITNFKFGDYFYPEPSIFSINTPIKHLTVGHLEKAIKIGRLDEEVINE